MKDTAGDRFAPVKPSTAGTYRETRESLFRVRRKEVVPVLGMIPALAWNVREVSAGASPINQPYAERSWWLGKNEVAVSDPFCDAN
jgi:hypothetical protein